MRGARFEPRRAIGITAFVLGPALGLGLLGAACNSTSSTSGTSTTLASAHSRAKSIYVTVGKLRVRVPTEIHGQIPSPEPGATQAGQQILITPSGIHPTLLLATQGLRVVWTNLTDRPQRVIFTNAAGGSGLIPPGGKFSMQTPRSESYTFRTATGLNGVLNVDPNIPSLP
jgi:hypothetical protein